MESWLWVAERWWLLLSILGIAAAVPFALRIHWRSGPQRFNQTASSDGNSKIDQSISVK